MELFSEIYSCYFKVVEKILNKANKEPITKENIMEIINKDAFADSAFYIIPKLIEGEWNLLQDLEGKYVLKLEGAVERPITKLERAWIKALLEDKRICLFLKKEQIEALKEQLKDTELLFHTEDFYCCDVFSDGDDYENDVYIMNFRSIRKALKNKECVTISFESSRNKRITGNYLPLKLEYSSKDDKFRVNAARIHHGKLIVVATINLARVVTVEPCEDCPNKEIEFEDYARLNSCKEPVVIEIFKERNAVERCMLHFASYEKRTEYDEAADRYFSYIYYDKQDETELLIRILSFGPVIKVLGPERFLNLVKERVDRQAELLGI